MTEHYSNVNLWALMGWTMLHFLWMGCIAFVIAAGVRWLVRRFTAELRYLSALVCLMGVTAAAAAALLVSLQQVDSAVRESQLGTATHQLASAEATTPLPAEWNHSGMLPPMLAPSAEPPDQKLTAQEAFRCLCERGE